MKCGACQYEYKQEWLKGKQVVKGDVEFIKIEGTFFITEEGDYLLSRPKMVDIYACPKCGTIRMEE